MYCFIGIIVYNFGFQYIIGTINIINYEIQQFFE